MIKREIEAEMDKILLYTKLYILYHQISDNLITAIYIF